MRRVGLALMLLLGLPAGAFAAGKPDLVVSSVQASPAEIPLGGQVTVSDTVKNSGKGTAPRTEVAYYVAADVAPGKVAALLGRRSLGKLKRGKSSSGRGTFRFPATLPAGSYHVSACADPGRKIKEKKEGNNCRTSATGLRVVGIDTTQSNPDAGSPSGDTSSNPPSATNSSPPAAETCLPRSGADIVQS